MRRAALPSGAGQATLQDVQALLQPWVRLFDDSPEVLERPRAEPEALLSAKRRT